MVDCDFSIPFDAVLHVHNVLLHIHTVGFITYDLLIIYLSTSLVRDYQCERHQAKILGRHGS
jgi:hypothetical protein